MKTPLELGRRLREGRLAEEARVAMKTESLAAIASAVFARLDAIDVDKLDLAAAVAARDDAESLLVLLGFLGDVEAERRVASRIATFDARMLARRDAWGATAVTTKDPWLRRIAGLDASPWWLDVVALGVLRASAPAFDPASVLRDRPPAARLELRARAGAASKLAQADVVGMEDDPARVAIERGAVIARMFEGEIEVFALGLRSDQADLPAGLCVARTGGGVGEITRVALADIEGGRSPSGWWAPLPASGSASLVVRLGEREETLSIDLVP